MILNEIINNYLVRLNELKILKECYEIRLHLIKSKYALKDEYEKNETDILKVKTIYIIRTIDFKIKDLDAEFQENYGRLIEELEFAEKETV